MRRHAHPALTASLLFATLVACSDAAPSGTDGGVPKDSGLAGPRDAGEEAVVPETVPDFESASFSSPLDIDNALWPLTPGTSHAYFGGAEDSPEIIIIQVLDDARLVDGVDTRVVRDRVFVEGRLIEDTHDWYAQDDDGNVWYMGEEVDDYEYDDQGEVIDITHGGAWEAGRDVADTGHLALPGYQMLATPTAGRIYHQEYYPGEAEDAAEILSIEAPVTLETGRTFTTVNTRDYSTSDTTIDGLKFYAEGIGVVLETAPDGSDRVEYLGTFDEAEAPPSFVAATFTAPTLIDNPFLPLVRGSTLTYQSQTEDGLEEVIIEVLSETRTVAGVDCVVVRDRVYVDDIIIEDTHDWYAQDDAGNVWYMGESVDDYIYDDEGNLLEITHPGSWEAGEDVANTGSPAEPGIVMWAAPEVGDSYRQELYEGEAEDMAYVISINASITLSDGTTYTGCVQTLDWVPLDAAAVEIKYYAPGVGQVFSKHVESPEVVELVSTAGL